MLVVLQLSPSRVSLNYLQRNLNIVPIIGLEPIHLAMANFKSAVSTYSTIRA